MTATATSAQPATASARPKWRTSPTALGDEDDELEAADFDDSDLDDNQVQDGGPGVNDQILLFAFVDNDGVVTFDSTTGLDIVVLTDAGAPSADGDANPETCDAADDLDCDGGTNGDGDGVVVAIAFDDGGTSSEPGDTVGVDIFQADDTGNVQTQTINIVGDPDGITLDVLKNPIQVSEDSAAVDTCVEESDVSDSDQLSDVNRTFLKATVTDDDDTALTRIAVVYEVDDDGIATFDGEGDVDDDEDDDAGDPSAMTAISVDAGAAGIGSFLVLCGGEDPGTVTVTATETQNDNDADATVDVVGGPDALTLTASPAGIECNSVSTSTVTATVVDAEGNPVVDGTSVNFSVVALGTANPINATTTAGVATSTITPLTASVAGVTVVVTAGDAQGSILIGCNTPGAATPTPGGPAPAPTPTPAGGIAGPDTGTGGYGSESSAGFPMWTLVALALGSLALVTGGLVTRRIGK